MKETSRITRIFRIFYTNILSKKYNHYGAHFNKPLKDKSSHRSENEFSQNKILSSFVYFGFIGLGSKNSLNSKKSSGSQNREEEWKRERDVSQHIALAELAIKQDEIKKAEFILQNTIRLNKEKPTVGITCVYDMLATLAYKEGNILKAKDVLENGIKYLISNGFDPNNESVVKFRLKLARVLSELGTNKEAEEQFKTCLAIQKMKYQSNISNEEIENLWINCLFWYGKHLSNNKKYLEAKECFNAAYTLSVKTKSVQNNQIMVILFNLSEMSFLNGEKDQALHYLLNAVMLGRFTDNADLAIYYNRIGLLFLSKGLLHEARHWCETGKEKGKRSHNRRAETEGEGCIRKINELIKLYTA